MWLGSYWSSHYTAHMHSWPPPSASAVIRSHIPLHLGGIHTCLWMKHGNRSSSSPERKARTILHYLPSWNIFQTVSFAIIHLTNESKLSHVKCSDTKPQSIHFNLALFSPPAMNESKNFRAPFLIDLPKILPPPPSQKTLLAQKGFFSAIIQRLLARSFSCPLLLAEEKGGTSNPEQIKMTFEPFLLYFFSWADFFGEAVIRGLNPAAASRLLTNRCWASFVPATLISPACQALQKEV